MTSYTSYDCLQNKNVIITGGASGIGEELVKAFCAQGSYVSFLDIDQNAGGKLCEELKKIHADRVKFYHCDITNLSGLHQTITTIATTKPIDVLVNNAASDTRIAFENLTPDTWHRSLAINLNPIVFAMQAVASSMKQSGEGSIINIGSNHSRMARDPNLLPYIAAKSAMEGITHQMAHTLGANNIRVNCVLPGWIMTDKQLEQHVTPEALAACIDEQAVKRSGQCEDVANLVLFLASEKASFISGQIIAVDGGRTYR
ncbi:MAG: SDR family NAD(P)-dependent oxidoreductase [Holosporaceae bacterium]|jgi:NAD(P)-dependent dehydrogenase (short-subunit alcohol dehydrogenase family)